MIVPLFALANAGIVLSWSFLSSAFTSPITLGILIGYVLGKPIGVVGASWLVTRLTRGRLRPPVGWASVARRRRDRRHRLHRLDPDRDAWCSTAATWRRRSSAC